ncbi:hypothetical protein ACIA8K_12615 [Catenuloplanes sp. NPDC051500]|uniref:hypothetical protein n=1 Tax=Catenuloplanes sp. NPDC051500 TaxID=3363959 RepID=UPI0037974B37
MAITSFPYDDQDTTETQFSTWARELQDSGVADSANGNGLKVSGGGGGMAVQIQAGSLIARGHFLTSSAVETRTIATAPTSGIRYDRVVGRINPATNAGELAVLTGTVGAGVPALTQTDAGIFEVSLGTVTVTANATTIDAARVADDRSFVGTRIRSWSSSTRPASARLFQLGYNTSTSRWEFWNGATWQNLATATSENASNWGGYSLTVSTSQPSGTPSADRIWVQPTA